jgi:hypothetical protein
VVFPDAPDDGNIYGRKDLAWEYVPVAELAAATAAEAARAAAAEAGIAADLAAEETRALATEGSLDSRTTAAEAAIDDRYTKAETDDLVNQARISTYHFSGWITETDPRSLAKPGERWLDAPAPPPAAGPWPLAVKTWDADTADWLDAEYTPQDFDIWSLPDTPEKEGWYWFAEDWNRLDQNLDLSAYRTAAAQDIIDQAQDAAIAARLEKSAAAGTVYGVGENGTQENFPLGWEECPSVLSPGWTAAADGHLQIRWNQLLGLLAVRVRGIQAPQGAWEAGDSAATWTAPFSAAAEQWPLHGTGFMETATGRVPFTLAVDGADLRCLPLLDGLLSGAVPPELEGAVLEADILVKAGDL